MARHATTERVLLAHVFEWRHRAIVLVISLCAVYWMNRLTILLYSQNNTIIFSSALLCLMFMKLFKKIQWNKKHSRVLKRKIREHSRLPATWLRQSSTPPPAACAAAATTYSPTISGVARGVDPVWRSRTSKVSGSRRRLARRYGPRLASLECISGSGCRSTSFSVLFMDFFMRDEG